MSLLAKSLTPREHAVLDVIATTRVVTADHIAQIVFAGQSQLTAKRLAHRHLQRAEKSGLVRRLENSSRDHRRPGRLSYVYVLTNAGLTLTDRLKGIGATQRTAWRPAPSRLDHWLDIADLYARLIVDAVHAGPAIREFLVEGDAQRVYRDAAGRPHTVRPDALVRLVTDGLELSWFIEIDRSTEGQRLIAEKCDAYRRYELTGIEQAEHGIFPGVLFIVPNEARARLVADTLAAQPPDARGLFQVATTAEALTALRTP